MKPNRMFKKSRIWQHLWICFATLVWLCCPPTPSIAQTLNDAEDPEKLLDLDPTVTKAIVTERYQVGSVLKPELWDRFQVFVWQYKTDIQQDFDLYRNHGLSAFHIDRGAGQENRVDWAKRQQLPYYVDHAAGKGILHMTQRSGLGQLNREGTLQSRPYCLVQRATLRQLTEQIDQNLSVARKGPALAIALDDEISLGIFTSPLEVDSSDASVEVYQRWLQQRYTTIDRLNAQWGSSFKAFGEVRPVNFELVRERITGQPFSHWNLSPWIDWRTYMDTQFAAVIGHLVKYAGTVAPNIPVGFVGGQQPSPYGGFDYQKLSQAVQWIESYDIGGTNELLVSLWHDSRKPIVQTFFATGDAWRDQWFLWYYWAHGNSAVIAWPDRGGKGWFQDGKAQAEVRQLASTFRDVQNADLNFPASAHVRRNHDPIALLYSHESVQASWATDALTHGKTWPRRSSSLDNNNSSAGKNRIAWNKLLEDCGFQARWITVEELQADVLIRDRYKALILPRAMALSDSSCQAIVRFHQQGGGVMADYWTGLFDHHGKARQRSGKLVGGLDDLFGVTRDESAGYFDGKTTSEVDGERYHRPFLQRLPEYMMSGEKLHVVELGTEVQGNDRAIYLNLSPIAYCDPVYRTSKAGARWRAKILKITESFGLKPFVRVFQNDLPASMVEVIRWQAADFQPAKDNNDKGNKDKDNKDVNEGPQQWLVLIPNPTREAAIDGAGEMQRTGGSAELELRFELAQEGWRDVLTGESYGTGRSIVVPARWPRPVILEQISVNAGIGH